ncbi:hypothetical protein [Bradyrhizobium sp. SZCCHNR1075]|uniref:hypothetical protein n=1 Tax=Bradyrhizobium sp. SZCCHNR1075 TaxID=3057362 RepID=UPI0028E2CED6|nr:hypothetical protein [Bradyrhizobium sp. SZCCHNR1075]
MRRARLKAEGRGPLPLNELLDLPIHNTDRTLLAFGRAMAAWARIEVGFYTWFEHITAFDMRQAKPIYYSATNFKSRLDLLRAAIEGVQLDRAEETFIKAAMDVVIRYNSFRNKLAHGEFTFDGLLIEGKHVDRRQARAEAISAEQLQRFAALATEFSTILSRAYDLAFGVSEDDDNLATLEKCTEQMKALPRTFTSR